MYYIFDFGDFFFQIQDFIIGKPKIEIFSNFSKQNLRVGRGYILKFSFLISNIMIIIFWFFDSDPRQTLWSSPPREIITLKLSMMLMLHWMLSRSCHSWSMKHMLFSVPCWHYGHHWTSSISRLLDYFSAVLLYASL